MPGQLHLTAGVAGGEQADEAFASFVGESFSGDPWQPPGAVERVVAAAAVADGLVLHPPAALIECRVGHPYDVERVGDLDGVGQHRVEHARR